MGVIFVDRWLLLSCCLVISVFFSFFRRKFTYPISIPFFRTWVIWKITLPFIEVFRHWRFFIRIANKSVCFWALEILKQFIISSVLWGFCFEIVKLLENSTCFVPPYLCFKKTHKPRLEKLSTTTRRYLYPLLFETPLVDISNETINYTSL